MDNPENTSVGGNAPTNDIDPNDAANSIPAGVTGSASDSGDAANNAGAGNVPNTVGTNVLGNNTNAAATVGGGPPVAPAGGNDSTILKTVPVTEVVESKNDNVTELPLAALPKAGFKISKFILFIISGYLVFLAIFLSFKSFDASDKIVIPAREISDSSFAHQKELIQSLQQEKKDYREFIMQISQMILLNLLLPTLTAVLGYIFGSREEAQTRRTP